MVKEKLHLTFWQNWNMNFGVIGVQFAFALENSNTSRIFQSLGAGVEILPILWLAGPITAILVQPIIGHLSDKTWTVLGRRRPYFFFSSIVISSSLITMANVRVLWLAIALVWVIDAAINCAAEPYRSLVSDNMPNEQQLKGYSMQSFFASTGSVLASLLPWIFMKLGVTNYNAVVQLPQTLKYSLYLGALVIILCISWSVFNTTEYPPEELVSFDKQNQEVESNTSTDYSTSVAFKMGTFWVLMGAGATFLIFYNLWNKEFYALTIAITCYGLILLVYAHRKTSHANVTYFDEICDDFVSMPKVMKQLASVQFFSWLALFLMWTYTTPTVTSIQFGSSDTTTSAYNDGADWVGVLFAVYNGVAAIASILLPKVVAHIGLRLTHFVNLSLGGVGLALFLVIKDPHYLLFPMIGIGFAWASIISIPYAMFRGELPIKKVGVYMGISNIFLAIPQLVGASTFGWILSFAFDDKPEYALLIGAFCFVISGLLTFRVTIEDEF